MAADLILAVHGLIVLFNVLSLPLIWLGGWLGWAWVRHRGFRIAQLGLMAFIAAEAILGITCPLTLWEDQLRAHHDAAGFVQRWLFALLYWDWPGWVFTLIYAGWTLLIVATWWRVPPTPRTKRLVQL